jgi:hypothetical protein
VDRDLVFTTVTGAPIDGRTLIRKSFRPLLRRARLPPIRLHDLRHTYASLALARGVHPKVVGGPVRHYGDVAVPKGWKPPEKCDQCPHSIEQHVLWTPDLEEQEDGWMHCGVSTEELQEGCEQCWHSWSFVDGTRRRMRSDRLKLPVS